MSDQVIAVFMKLPKALYPRGQKQYLSCVEEAKQHAKSVAKSKGAGYTNYENSKGEFLFSSLDF